MSMKKYELVYVLRPELGEDLKNEIKTKVLTIIREAGGESLKQEEWGKLRMAYTIKGNQKGYYYFILFQAEGHAVKEIERILQINENVLRYMTVLHDPKTINFSFHAAVIAAPAITSDAQKDGAVAVGADEGSADGEDLEVTEEISIEEKR